MAYFGGSVPAAVLGVLFFSLANIGCSGSAPSSKDKTEAPRTEDDFRETGLVASQAARELQEFRLVQQDGDVFTQKDLEGKLIVASVFYTQSPGNSGLGMTVLKQLQKRLKEADAEGVHLVSVSVDSENDTPATLKAYGTVEGVDFDSWSLLTGSEKPVWDFCRTQLGLQLSRNPDDPLMPFSCDSRLVLIDRTSRIRGYFPVESSEGSVDRLWEAIDEVLPEFAPAGELQSRYEIPEAFGHLAQPPGILESEWLVRQAGKERQRFDDMNFGTDLHFVECGRELGLNFFPQIVDDQRHRLLVNHYDHGNSISGADVNGDGFTDLYFTSQVGANELWLGTAKGGFTNGTLESNAGLEGDLSVAASFADIDNDGDPDLFVTTIRTGNVLLENLGGGNFREITDESGLSYSGHSSTGTFFDFDRDGLLDLYVANVGKFTTEEEVEVRADEANSQPETSLRYFVGRPDAFSGHLAPTLSESSRLYRNLGNRRFEDVTAEVGISGDPSWSGAAIAFDANGDTWPDLYVCNMQGHDRLYLNKEGATFEEATGDYFQATPWGTMGVNVSDFNNDGLLDLFTTDMHSDMSVDVGPDEENRKSKIAWPEEFLRSEGKSIYGNALFLSDTSGRFDEDSQAWNAENYWPWGLSCADLNADGFQDAFVTSSMCFPYRYGMNSLLLNNAGRGFVEARFASGIEPRAEVDQIAPWFALDFDGADSEHPLRKNRSGKWMIWSATGSRSSLVLDYDHDGDLDIITNEFNTRPQVFRNELLEGTLSYLMVQLNGTTSNRDGIGAVVTIQLGENSQTKILNGASGYLSQSVVPLYFGLGPAAVVDQIEVQWPAGKLEMFKGPFESNQTITLTEGAAE